MVDYYSRDNANIHRIYEQVSATDRFEAAREQWLNSWVESLPGSAFSREGQLNRQFVALRQELKPGTKVPLVLRSFNIVPWQMACQSAILRVVRPNTEGV